MVSDLVKMLSEGKHEITIGHNGDSLEDIKKRINDGFVHINFINTKGGTEIGIKVDLKNTKLSNQDISNDANLMHIEGTANLNYSEVRCIADIDLISKKGQGFLVVL